jgi:hypothetical protein
VKNWYDEIMEQAKNGCFEARLTVRPYDCDDNGTPNPYVKKAIIRLKEIILGITIELLHDDFLHFKASWAISSYNASSHLTSQ